jgi:hypothetical protein
MGWTTTRNTNQTPTDFINTHVLYSEDIAAIEAEDNNLYVAYRLNDTVSALVVLREFEGNEVSYKVLDETEGPFEAHASQAFLDVLSPTDNQYAIEWRSRCSVGIRLNNSIAKAVA